METSYLTNSNNSKKIVTLAYLREFLSDFWSITYRQTRSLWSKRGVVNAKKWAWFQKFTRAVV